MIRNVLEIPDIGVFLQWLELKFINDKSFTLRVSNSTVIRGNLDQLGPVRKYEKE